MPDSSKTAETPPKEAQPPYLRWRYPPGCPDPDWCFGNGCCYWRCAAEPDEDLYGEASK